MSSHSILDYPVYPSQESYSEWIISWMANLIRILDNSDISTIFKVCRNLKENNIPSFLLPHLILYNVIIGQGDFINDLVIEILAVLNDLGSERAALDSDFLVDVESKDREKRQLCTQVSTYLYLLKSILLDCIFTLGSSFQLDTTRQPRCEFTEGKWNLDQDQIKEQDRFDCTI